MRLVIGVWIVGALVIAGLVVTRLVVFGPEQATPFDTILLVLSGMAIFLGAVLAWQVRAARNR